MVGNSQDYENSFRSNWVNGQMLQSVSVDSFYSDLGIMNYWHRMVILMAIRNLFTSIGTCGDASSSCGKCYGRRQPNGIIWDSVEEWWISDDYVLLTAENRLKSTKRSATRRRRMFAEAEKWYVEHDEQFTNWCELARYRLTRRNRQSTKC